jgi:serine phosphatase RsbU (regulator of sigma subunit)
LTVSLLTHHTTQSAPFSILQNNLQDDNTVEKTIQACRKYRDTDVDQMKKNAETLIKLAENDSLSDAFAWGHYFLGDYYYLTDQFDETEHHLIISFQAFNEIGIDQGIAESASSLANSYFYKDRYRTALNFAETALEKYYELGDLLQQSNQLTLICDIYTYMESYNQAIQYCVQSLRIKETLAIEKGKEITLNTMGLIYQELGTVEKARGYFYSALKVAINNGIPYNIATTHSNIGNFFLSIDKNDSAIYHFENALSIDSDAGDSTGLAYSYFDIAKGYRQKNNLEKAQKYLLMANLLAQKQQMPELLARICLELGDFYIDLQQYDQAIIRLKNSLAIAQKINSNAILNEIYQKLAKYYDLIGDKDNALVYMRLYILETEKNYREENVKSIAEIETLYSIEKKQKEIDLLRRENDIKQLQAEQRTFMLISLGAGSLLLVILIIILYSRNKLKNKANKALQTQNEAIKSQKAEIESQKEELTQKGAILEENNKQITDSITYARQIQESLLPSTKLFKQEFPKSFVYYKPKDIVSGDFYWYAQIEDKIALAVVDCTGHGVPGAFMTVLANSLLNQIILETGISSPDLVVSLLDQKIQQNLHQKHFGSISTDGLDIGLIFINLKESTIEFTGAKIPLYVINNNQLQTIIPDRYSVGSIQEINKTFSKKSVKIKKDSMIYMSTDGYQDQFGGSKDKKFMKKNFYEFLCTIDHLSTEDQEEKLQQKFQQWRGGHAQTDDVLVMGIRL